MKIRIVNVLVCLFFVTSNILGNDDKKLLEVKPQKGDGIISLLRNYDLSIHPCNTTKFLEINGLVDSDVLISGKSYKLPIYIYKYDNNSIRSTINDQDWDKAVRIKAFNKKMQTKGLKNKMYDADQVLWVPFHELECLGNASSDPPSAQKITPQTTEEAINKNNLYVGLFGKKYGEVNIEDYSLKNKVYYIIAGHGGPDPGAMCKNCPETMCEDEYAYDISLRLARDLMQHGAKVHVIIQDPNDGIRDEKHLDCDNDELCMGKEKLPLQQKPRLVQRAAEINKLYRAYLKKGIKDKDQLAIYLHVDSNNESKSQDVYFYHHKNSKDGKKMANKIRDKFDEKYEKHQKDRGYKGSVNPRGLYVLNYTQATSVFVELANIRNINDHRRLVEHTNRQAIANWLFEGITSK